jgi:D-beta-D-heptose 7-phosphate kinase/D-beta-D-heptose 1-phosphate adenosyltransferase
MKIYSTPEALNHTLRKDGYRTIVFTNGVFDLLHPGHIELLESARSQGDCLIVGINDDASVQRLKGDGRPILPLKERMEVLAAFTAVDFVIPFSQDTPLQLIRAIDRIDVLVKGGDYQPDQVVGRKEVEESGGRLYLFPVRSAYSTSKIIEKIKRSFGKQK